MLWVGLDCYRQSWREDILAGASPGLAPVKNLAKIWAKTCIKDLASFLTRNKSWILGDTVQGAFQSSVLGPTRPMVQSGRCTGSCLGMCLIEAIRKSLCHSNVSRWVNKMTARCHVRKQPGQAEQRALSYLQHSQQALPSRGHGRARSRRSLGCNNLINSYSWELSTRWESGFSSSLKL